MKKIRKKALVVTLSCMMLFFATSNGWGHGPHGGGHHGGRHYYHGWGHYYRGWGYYPYYYEPVPVPVYPRYYDYNYNTTPCAAFNLEVINVLPTVDGKPYLMDVFYNGRLLYKAVPQGERRLLRMRGCFSSNEKTVTIDVKDVYGNFIGTVTRRFYLDTYRSEVWQISLNDIQR